MLILLCVAGTPSSHSSTSEVIRTQNHESHPSLISPNLSIIQPTTPNESYTGSNQNVPVTPAVMHVLQTMQAEQRSKYFLNKPELFYWFHKSNYIPDFFYLIAGSQQTMIDYLIQIIGNQEELLRRTATEAEPISKKVKLSVDIPLQTLDEYQLFNDWLGTAANLEALVIFII